MNSYRLDSFIDNFDLPAAFADAARCSLEEAPRYRDSDFCITIAPSHKSFVMQQFLAEKSFPIITQPPYSPDLAHNDFSLFSTLGMGPKRTRFATKEDIKSNATAELPEDSKIILLPVLPKIHD
jgi:hypothetical protein